MKEKSTFMFVFKKQVFIIRKIKFLNSASFPKFTLHQDFLNSVWKMKIKTTNYSHESVCMLIKKIILRHNVSVSIWSKFDPAGITERFSDNFPVLLLAL